MQYLKFLLISILNVLISGGLSYGLFKYLTQSMGNSTGDMGMGIASLVISAGAFIILVVLVGFILLSLV